MAAEKLTRLYSALTAVGLAFVGLTINAKGQIGFTVQDSSIGTNSPRFTVRTSVEMARFGRVDHDPVFSPDGKNFVVVTSRGIIQSNEVESTIWLFATDAVKEWMRRSDIPAPAPKIFARLAAVPRIEYDSSYEAVISNVRWTPDSKRLFFLAQDSSASRRLYRADLNGHIARALTPPGQDVSQFDFASEAVVYGVTQIDENLVESGTAAASAHDITGLELTSILFPNTRTVSNYGKLWINRDGRNEPVIDPSSGQPVRLWNNPPPNWNVLSMSPDGKFCVILSPIKLVPQAWERYDPATIQVPRIRAQGANVNAEPDTARLTQYAVINLGTGLVKPVVNAPNGWALGYGDPNRATWSSDGKKLLLTNTYLTLDSSDNAEGAERVRPCAVAVTDLPSATTTCVSYGAEGPVTGASFRQPEDDVVIWFENDAVSRQFHFQGDFWQSEKQSGARDQDTPPACGGALENGYNGFLIQVKQDLNEPPTLAVTDCQAGQHKMLWNPNPQLARMELGDASDFRWKDESGYQWTGALLKPPGYVAGTRYPLVIQTYGFVPKEFLADGLFTTAFAARPLAAADIVVLQIWWRSDHAGTVDEVPEQILGYESAIARLTSEGLINPDRIGIAGFSRTCYHVESELIKNPLRFSAATIADGVDFSYLQHLLFSSTHRKGTEMYGAAPFGEGLRKWVDNAPGFHLDRIRTPLRIEAIGPASVLTEWEIYSSLREQNKPVDLVYIPDGQHILQKPLERMASQQGNVDWFRFWLKGEEDPDPTKAGQYARWRKLREMNKQNEDARPPN
jgi:dipeptidyl aminopeptidase/acylaminoacyl peptidase